MASGSAGSFWRPHRRGFLTSLMACKVLTGEQEPTFSTEVKVVSILANVVDKKGRILRDLAKDDFSVFEDGRPQSIRYFTKQSDLPLVLGLMVDSSMSQQRVIEPERTACFHFLDQVLRENKDKIFILQFDMNIVMRQPLTSSWKDLNAALSAVDTPSRQELRGQAGGGTLLYDAVVEAARIIKAQRNRKAVIILSDGVDNGSNDDLTTAVDAAQRSDTLVYSILFSDAGAYRFLGGGEGRSVLERLSKDSGAAFFEVTKKRTIEDIFEQIQDELRSQYSLGYVSDKPVTISEFRKIQLKTRQKDLIVQARDRYWAEP